jgi:hypothetical protein
MALLKRVYTGHRSFIHAGARHADRAERPTSSLKIEFSFMNGNLMAPTSQLFIFRPTPSNDGGMHVRRIDSGAAFPCNRRPHRGVDNRPRHAVYQTTEKHRSRTLIMFDGCKM